jgi:bifunctional non-homologous end joining protein LigD
VRAPAHAPRAPLPAGFHPQLALLVKDAPEESVWVHEIKFDGYRIGARLNRGKVQLLSRNGKDWTENFPSIASAVAAVPAQQALLDGEVAVVLPDGRTSFQALQNGAASGGQIAYFVFDLLHLDGDDVGEQLLEERKDRLARLLKKLPRNSPVRYAEHVGGRGKDFLAEACRLGLEGIISKRRDLPYQPGRGPGWVKTKCIKRQEFVIGGFTDPEGSRVGIGALLVGINDAQGALTFAGKVGTGFTQASARALRTRLTELAQPDSPFAGRLPTTVTRRAHWVRPVLVAEVAFTEWTNDGKIRHPSFQGLRDDKPPAEIQRERPAATPDPAPRADAARVTVGGISISHPGRVVYPDLGVTKQDVARFYEEIGDWILPHLSGRPLTLVRCPGGVAGNCFYMKHSGAWTPKGVRRERIQEKTKVGEYLVVDDLPALLTLVQANVLELHTWNATVDRIEKPDRIVFDLDPGPEVKWNAVVEAAGLVRTTLRELQLESFVKTTGGHGLHVVVPLEPRDDWRIGLAFAEQVANVLVHLRPRDYTTVFAKAGREKKILIDVARNNRLSTSVAAYSTRARPSGGVSTPLAWDELTRVSSGDQYTVRTLPSRLRRLRQDPWAAYWKLKQRIPPDGK